MPPHPVLALADYVPAVIAFVGVVVGGIVGGGVQFVFTRRHETGQRRSAARLVDADLGRARDVIQRCLGPPPRFVPEWAQELDLTSWEKERGVLAVALSGSAWTAVRDAVDAVDAFRRRLSDQQEAQNQIRLRKVAEDASAGIDGAAEPPCTQSPREQVAAPFRRPSVRPGRPGRCERPTPSSGRAPDRARDRRRRAVVPRGTPGCRGRRASHSHRRKGDQQQAV